VNATFKPGVSTEGEAFKFYSLDDAARAGLFSFFDQP